MHFFRDPLERIAPAVAHTTRTEFTLININDVSDAIVILDEPRAREMHGTNLLLIRSLLSAATMRLQCRDAQHWRKARAADCQTHS